MIKIGTYTGNASALTLELGFLPDFAMIFNVTDGESLEFYFKAATPVSIEQVGAAGLITNAANGISEFAGEAPFKQLTGLYSIADGVTALTGVGTLMETELKVGDRIRVGDQELVIQSITNATAAVVTLAADGAETSVIGVRVDGRPAGLNLGTDMSEDGDVYRYVAFGND